MKTSILLKKFLSVSLAIAMVLIAISGKTAEQVAAESSPEELGAIYLNSTNKYLHLGREETNSFEFKIKASMQDEDATYIWYVIENKGKPDSVSIHATTGVVTAKEAGAAYIGCQITKADGTAILLEAKVTVRNNISEVDISNMPKDNTIIVNEVMDFNRVILNTEAGKDKAASGITRWELAEDNAGVNEVSDKGFLTPSKEGTFKLRAVSFQSKEKYNFWLSDKVVYAQYVTAASEWYEVTVIQGATDLEKAEEAIRALFVDADAPNDEKALAPGITQSQIDAATTLVDKLTDENIKIFGHAAIAIAQGLFDEKLAEEETTNAANALQALTDLFVDINAPNDEKILAEGVTQTQLDEATALVNKLTDENSKVLGHAVIALAQGLLDERLVEEEIENAQHAVNALRELFVDISVPNDEKALADGVTQTQLDEATALVNKLTDENSRILGHAVIALAQNLLDQKLSDEADATMIDSAIKALEDLFVDGNEFGTQKILAEGVTQTQLDEATELVNNALAKAQELLDTK